MDIKQLRALLAIAETGSVTRAADILHIVQPAISRQLQLLEDDIGVSLFTRSRRGMSLTEDGEILAEYARRALSELDRARSEIQPSRHAIHGVVTVGLLPSTCDSLASLLVTEVGRKHPKIQLTISVGYAGYLQKWLDSGEVDVALLYEQARSFPLHVRPLLEEQLWAVGRASDELQLDRPITLSALAKHPLVLPSAPHGIRSLVEHACATERLKLQIVAETNSLIVQKSLVRSGHGLTILPSIAVSGDLVDGALSASPIANDNLHRTIVLALPSSRRITSAVQCVADTLFDVVKTATRQGNWAATRWIGRSPRASSRSG